MVSDKAVAWKKKKKHEKVIQAFLFKVKLSFMSETTNTDHTNPNFQLFV